MLVERILHIAKERLVSVPEDAPLLAAAKLLSGGHNNIVLVCSESGVVSGVLTKTDIVRQMTVCPGDGSMESAASVMTRDITACRPEDWLVDAWSVMKRTGLLQLPVLGPRGEALGVLYARDALQALLGEIEDEEQLLRDYVMSVGYR